MNLKNKDTSEVKQNLKFFTCLHLSHLLSWTIIRDECWPLNHCCRFRPSKRTIANGNCVHALVFHFGVQRLRSLAANSFARR